MPGTGWQINDVWEFTSPTIQPALPYCTVETNEMAEILEDDIDCTNENAVYFDPSCSINCKLISIDPNKLTKTIKFKIRSLFTNSGGNRFHTTTNYIIFTGATCPDCIAASFTLVPPETVEQI